jgi:hypothetical protein
MPQKKSLNFIIPLVVYPFDVMVSIGETDIALEKTLTKFGIKEDGTQWRLEDSPTTQGRCCLFDTNHGLIRLRRKPKLPVEFGQLQHEIFHYVTFILERIGMELIVMKSDEAYSYLIGYLTTEIYKKIK